MSCKWLRIGLNLAASLCGHSNDTSSYGKGQSFVRVRFSRVINDYAPVRWQSFVGGMVARLGNLVLACGIFLDSSAFMFRVTDPGVEGTMALLNVGIHLPWTRFNIPKDLMLDRTALRISDISV